MAVVGNLLDVPGLRIGHWTRQGTGTTVVLTPPDGAVAAVDVRGGAPASFDTELLRPAHLVQRVHAIVLTGGSAFGLEACSGVTRWLSEQGVGFEFGGKRVPIVCGAAIFDLGAAAGPPPDRDAGYQAAASASANEQRRGRVGAGTGATVGKALGPSGAMLGGLGMASSRCGRHVVAALAVVNAVGDIVDRRGEIVAGARRPNGQFADAMAQLAGVGQLRQATATHTTLGLVATTAPLDREGALKLAEMAQDGLARALRPAHTMFDGDMVFGLSVGAAGTQPTDVSALGAMAAEALQDAILDAVKP